MRAYERFIKYAAISTASDSAREGEPPSTKGQFDLARVLVDEMKEIGFENPHVDEYCYVYGWIPATPGCEALPALGLLAHMDTSEASSGEGVRPAIHHNYNGGDIHLPNGRVIPAKLFPELNRMKGETLITAGGETLLGADDKAGIAEILTACDEIIRGEKPHPRLCVAFTPDEEIGAGTVRFDVKKFDATYAYTVDGGDVNEIEYETFNAAGAKLSFQGVSVHPGSAKGIMVNASKLAMEYASLLPNDESPENTEDREGFYHLNSISGSVESAKLGYIIRDHDRAKFEARKETIRQTVACIREKYGPDSISLEIKDSYRNMREVIEQHFHLVEKAEDAIRGAGLTPMSPPVRGGTDGARLCYMGLPCPNLGTGGFFFHGPNECISVERMDKAVEILERLVALFSKE